MSGGAEDRANAGFEDAREDERPTPLECCKFVVQQLRQGSFPAYADRVQELIDEYERLLSAFSAAAVQLADRCRDLTEMEAELTRLRSELEAARAEADKRTREVELTYQVQMDLKQQNERLREALKSIGGNSCCDSCYEASKVARAALAADQSGEKE